MVKLIPSKQKVVSAAELALRAGAGFGLIGLGTAALGGQGIGGAIGSIGGGVLASELLLGGSKFGTEKKIVMAISVLNAVDLLLDAALNGRGVIG